MRRRSTSQLTETESLEWGPFEAIGSDLADSVRRIKAGRGPDLVVTGSSTLISVLLDHGLADEVVLLVNPIVLGKGKRFRCGSLPPADLRWAYAELAVRHTRQRLLKPVPAAGRGSRKDRTPVLEREYEIARERLQERLFHRCSPSVAGVEIAAHCRPAQAVGGDYYDLIDIRDGLSSNGGITAHGCDRLGIAIGDISGKGMSAALLMASLHASLHGQVLGGA